MEGAIPSSLLREQGFYVVLTCGDFCAHHAKYSTLSLRLLPNRALLFRCWITGSCAPSFYHNPFMYASVYRTEMSEHGIDTLECKDGWWERFLSI